MQHVQIPQRMSVAVCTSQGRAATCTLSAFRLKVGARGVLYLPNLHACGLMEVADWRVDNAQVVYFVSLDRVGLHQLTAVLKGLGGNIIQALALGQAQVHMS